MYTYVRTLVIVFYTKYLESFFINRDKYWRKRKKRKRRKKRIIKLYALWGGTLSLKIHCETSDIKRKIEIAWLLRAVAKWTYLNVVLYH